MKKLNDDEERMKSTARSLNRCIKNFYKGVNKNQNTYNIIGDAQLILMRFLYGDDSYGSKKMSKEELIEAVKSKNYTRDVVLERMERMKAKAGYRRKTLIGWVPDSHLDDDACLAFEVSSTLRNYYDEVMNEFKLRKEKGYWISEDDGKMKLDKKDKKSGS